MKKIESLFRFLNSVSEKNPALYPSIMEDVVSIKTAAVYPGGHDETFGPGKLGEDLKNVQSGRFRYFDFDLYAENSIDKIQDEDKKKLHQEKAREFIGKCFYEELIDNKLYDVMPDIIKDKSVISKSELAEKIDRNIESLPEEMKKRYLDIKKSILSSKRPFFLFLYDPNIPGVDISWKYILHDTVHIIKDFRIKDVKDVKRILPETPDRPGEIMVSGNHHFPDSFTSFAIFKKIIEDPVSVSIVSKINFSPRKNGVQKKVKRIINELRKTVDDVSKIDSLIEKMYASRGTNTAFNECKRILHKKMNSGVRRKILFYILQNCLIFKDTGEKVELLQEKDDPDRRTDLFAFHLFFGRITIDLDRVKDERTISWISNLMKQECIEFLDIINGVITDFVKENNLDIDIDKFLIKDADLLEDFREASNSFVKDFDKIKKTVDIGFSEYENFAKDVESVYEMKGYTSEGGIEYELSDDKRSDSGNKFLEYPNIGSNEYKRKMKKRKDVDFGQPLSSKKEQVLLELDNSSHVFQEETVDEYKGKLSFLHSLLRSSNPFYDRMIQLTSSGPNKKDPNNFVYAFIRI